MCPTASLSSFVVVTLLVGLSRAEPQCHPINETVSNVNIQCGYNFTARFNSTQNFQNVSQDVASLKSLLKNCSSFVDTMICSLYLPRCSEEIKGPYLPCKGVCHDYANECSDVIQTNGLQWTTVCDDLPEKDNPHTTKGYMERCFTPPNYKDGGITQKQNSSQITTTKPSGNFSPQMTTKKAVGNVSTLVTTPMTYAKVTSPAATTKISGKDTITVTTTKGSENENTAEVTTAEVPGDPRSSSTSAPGIKGPPEKQAKTGRKISAAVTVGILLGFIGGLAAIVAGVELYKRCKRKKTGYRQTPIKMDEI